VRRFLVLIAIAATGLVGCASSTSSSSSSSGCQKIKVLTTVTQVSALVRAVGADCVDLTALLRPTDDPHAYEMKPADVGALSSARIIFKSGAGIDKWIDKSITAAAPNTPTVDLSTSVKLRQSSEGDDPHWWYDVDNAKAAADAIAAQLGKMDPANKDTYTKNATALKGRLDDADKQVHALIDPIDPSKRLFVANHDAFNYFLARYNITLVGDIIPSTDTLSAVKPADTAKLITDIKSKGVKAIFTETTLDSGVASQIARETGAKVFDGKLYGDAIGDAGSDGATLEGALVHNGQAMASAFKL
jgi:zinc/manganese transport system substrate-binding protein/manganese/iron transport system substrate-binding protein